MTPLEAAHDWLARGFLPVPVPFRQKAPVVNGWQKLRLRPEDLPRYFDSQPQNMGILLGDDCGTADIDCDCMEAVAAAVEFAPATGICFGRQSKPASHYIYRSVPAVRFRKFADPTDKSTMVELRGQKTNGTVGLQTVVPPSVHPSGEQIRFEPGADKQPGVADAAGLTRAVARIAAAALLARHWPKEGSRHVAFLASAGILARAGWSVQDVSGFHRAIYRALWGGDSDFGLCESEVCSTFEKRSEAGEVTGFQTLAGLIHSGVLQTALGWLGIAKHMAVPVVQWPQIAPFLVRAAPPLHADLFPGFLGDMVAAVSQATETPIELPGLLGLGIVATCVARKVTVSPEPGYEEALNVFVAVGMESGNRKTAVLRAMAQPVVEWEFAEKERLQPERDRLLSERKTLEAQIEALRKKAARSLAARDLVAQIAELEGTLPEVPALPICSHRWRQCLRVLWRLRDVVLRTGWQRALAFAAGSFQQSKRPRLLANPRRWKAGAHLRSGHRVVLDRCRSHGWAGALEDDAAGIHARLCHARGLPSKKWAGGVDRPRLLRSRLVRP